MPTPTYDLIASNVLSSSASSVTFSSIPATYRDLVLVITMPDTSGYTHRFRFNGDTGNNYSYVNMWGNGSTTTSESLATANNFGYFRSDITIFQVMDYSATDKHKSVLYRYNLAFDGETGFVVANAGRWANTSAVTSIEVYGSTYPSGSTFYLYGIVS